MAGRALPPLQPLVGPHLALPNPRPRREGVCYTTLLRPAGLLRCDFAVRSEASVAMSLTPARSLQDFQAIRLALARCFGLLASLVKCKIINYPLEILDLVHASNLIFNNEFNNRIVHFRSNLSSFGRYS
jgi:hypothetical protein